MQQYIFGLHYDYVEQGDQYIVFKKADGVLVAHDLTPLQVQVLQSNDIPHLLPFEKHELNGEITLLYRCTDLQTLAQVLEKMTIGMSDYYKLLLNILSGLEQSELYMLDDQRFILHERFIFVRNGVDDDVHLCYLPVKTVAEHDATASLLEQFVLKLIPYVEGIEEVGLKKMIASIRDPEMSISSVKSAILSLLESKPHPIAIDSKKTTWLSKLFKRFDNVFNMSNSSDRSAVTDESSSKDPEQYYRELPQHTTILKRRANEEGQAFLHVEVQDGLERIALGDRPFSIGRDNAQCVDIMDMLGVSREHCEIIKVGHAWYVKDLGSSNGSQLNDAELVPYDLNELNDGDELTIVKNKFKFQMLKGS